MSAGDYKEFVNESDGWPGSKFEHKTTTVQIRRVKSDDRDEAQMEISITEIKSGGKMYRHHGSLTLTPDQAREFSEAILGKSEIAQNEQGAA